MTTATDLLHDPPPVLYVPTIRANDGQEHIALRRMADGRTALLVYTALDRLRDCVGPDSAWVLVDWRGLESVQRQSPFDVILPDLVVPDEHRHDGGWL